MRAGGTVSHYRVLEKVGEGGMGTVWKAEDVHLRRVVALKFLHAAEDVPRLLREAQAAASLTHPHIGVVYEVDPERGFIAMEWVEGRTLAERIGGRPLPAEEAVALALQVGEGLKAAHHRGIVHRDVKSANVMVTPQGQAKILDFGLARVAGQAGLTREGAAAGTPGYMAPEQMRGEPVDRRTDIWAFGAVLHEMLTGRLPIGSMGTLPQGFDRVVQKALAADPAERYQHVDDMLVDLRRAGARTPTPPAWRRRAVIVGAVAVPLAAALAWRLKLAGKRYSSLAVLPLENLSGDAGQEWFSDGMTETLISELSKVRSLRVISRTSVMHYKKQPKPLKTVARELDVEAVVEGATQKLGERAHITARLIDAATERPLWSDDFDRDTGDVITLHRELARAIAREVRATLDAGVEKALSPARKARPEAVEAYLRGLHLLRKGPNKLPEVLELAREAVRIDPDHAEGHVLVGRTLQLMGDFALAPYAEVVPESRAEIRRAIELEPDLAEAYRVLSASYTTSDHDWEAAEQAARKAQELDPTSNISGILFARGKVEEALAVNRRIFTRDPLNVGAIINVGRNLYTLDRFEESLEWHRKAVAIEPENGYARFFFVWSAFQAGKLDVAAEALVNWAPPEEKEPLRAAYMQGGWNSLCREALRLASSRPSPPNLSAQRIAREKVRYGVFLKDNEMALDGLEELEKTNDSWLAQLPDGGLRALRQEPRFKALLKRLRYPESMWK